MQKTKTPIAALITLLTLLVIVPAWALAPQAKKIDTALTDQEFFQQKLNLDYPGLEKVKQAAQKGDLAAAKQELASYYRQRTSKFFRSNPWDLSGGKGSGRSHDSTRALIERSGEYDASLWQGDIFDWNNAKMPSKERMYFFGSIGRDYAATGDEEIAKAWVNLVRNFVSECPIEKGGVFWSSMTLGIRLRSGWPEAFLCLVKSPSLTPDDLVLFLKSVYEQTDSVRHHHDATSNWLTFAMAGLYTSGVVYPEFKDATEWRKYACNTAVTDMEIGWLPDGMSIELTPGYGQFFYNYYIMYDLARHVGRLDEFNLREFMAKTERPYELYLKIMAPDRSTPATNDNDPQDSVGILQRALERFPNRQDFRWVVSEGKEGTKPDYTSILLPYAGFAALRSGWNRDDNMLYFDMGPVGFRHVHQDKLEVVLWAYGRQILFDPGRSNYQDAPHQNYCMDTHSHNTVMVDNRPQRRKWYHDPAPEKMPYQKRTDLKWETTDKYDYAAGIYDEHYGLPGHTNAYPYHETDKSFSQGWGAPATHYRRVFFYKPDIFLIADTLVSKDGQPHKYDVRWHLDTTRTKVAPDGFTVTTADASQPNLEIVPLLTKGLTIKTTSAQDTPEILGWKITDKSYPATTLQHFKAGPDTIQFLTLLLPLKSGQESLYGSTKTLDDSTAEIVLEDGRVLTIKAPTQPEAKLMISNRSHPAE